MLFVLSDVRAGCGDIRELTTLEETRIHLTQERAFCNNREVKTMTDTEESTIHVICEEIGRNRNRLMDVLLRAQRKLGRISDSTIDSIAVEMKLPRVEVESLATFYSFFSKKPGAKVIIRLCNDIVDRMQGVERIADTFMDELGIEMGETTPDGLISLEWTPCIGMSDQAPAALIGDVVFTRLSSDHARAIVKGLKKYPDPHQLIREFGDGNNSHDLIGAMVENNIRRRGPVIFAEEAPGQNLGKALAMTPAEVIRNIKTARLRGRGGAGFPTGMKWEYTRAATGQRKYLICNADEGEPGTFKDRVILTERPHLMFEGMTIGGYAIGARDGIVYLRGEYTYLKSFLESILVERRRLGLLGKNICGKDGFDFDIRIQMGAGAYICGEETALISSCEGQRGDPKNRPPFPAQEGYLGQPTSVNNVETLCCVSKIIEHGPGWFTSLGSAQSSGTKLLSVSGDCRRPGVYEVSMGITLKKVLEMAGAENAAAVQVGGPSGEMVAPDGFERAICYDDLATGGSIMVFGPQRDLLEVVEAFMDFFVEESCGYCTPCRVGNSLIRKALRKVRERRATPDDLASLEKLCHQVARTSRCGLGQTSPNPVLSTLKSFPELWREKLNPEELSTFDLEGATKTASEIAGRESSHLSHRMEKSS